jgi:hypothetical protein
VPPHIIIPPVGNTETGGGYGKELMEETVKDDTLPLNATRELVESVLVEMAADVRLPDAPVCILPASIRTVEIVLSAKIVEVVIELILAVKELN